MRKLEVIDSSIAAGMQQIAGGEVVPYGLELDSATSKIQALEERLRSMGSLSALSPLEALKELSELLPASMDVTFDSMNIAQSRITLSGSVNDFPAVGKLSTLLRQRPNRFCNVKVDPKGQQSGSNRIRVVTEITLCE